MATLRGRKMMVSQEGHVGSSVRPNSATGSNLPLIGAIVTGVIAAGIFLNNQFHFIP